MQTLTPRSNQARFRLSLLCSSTRISRYEQTLFERLAQDGSAQLHRAIVMPAVSTGRQSFWRIAPRLVNHIVQFAEWQFLKLLPARFSGLGWRGRSVMPGSTDVVTVFNTVSRLDTSLSSGAVQTPAPGTAEVVVCTEPALYKTARSSIPEAHWIVIDGLGDRSSQTTAGFSAVFSGRDTTDFRILIWRAGQPLPHRVIEGKPYKIAVPPEPGRTLGPDYFLPADNVSRRAAETGKGSAPTEHGRIIVTGNLAGQNRAGWVSATDRLWICHRTPPGAGSDAPTYRQTTLVNCCRVW